nr:unnamed protein product [Callosobruchus analis]
MYTCMHTRYPGQSAAVNQLKLMRNYCFNRRNCADKIKNIRVEVDEIFDKIFSESESLLKELDVVINVPRLSIRQTQRLLNNTDNAKDYFKITIIFPFLDVLLRNLEDRFLKHKKLIQNFESLFSKPNDDFEKQLERILNLHNFYEENGFFKGFTNKMILRAELEMWHKKNANKNIKEGPLKKFLQIFITLPITTVTSERSFSNFKYLKNYLRNSTSESMLNGLGNLYSNHDILVTPEEVFDKMVIKWNYVNLRSCC